jgi:hypothetical protein
MTPKAAHRLPSLGEVLSGAAKPPFTLDRFRLFLHHNHCIEILNFLESAERYRESFASCEIQSGYLSWGSNCRPEVELLRWLWQSLLSTFILSGSSQEIDLSNEERICLLAYQSPAIPPAPCLLEPIVRRLYDQLDEEIFQAFLASQSQCSETLRH